MQLTFKCSSVLKDVFDCRDQRVEVEILDMLEELQIGIKKNILLNEEQLIENNVIRKQV